MTVPILIVLVLLGLSVVLLSQDRFSVDLVTLSLLIVLVLTGILTTQEAFAGFSSDIIIILASIFIIGGAFQETGIIEAASARLIRFARGGPRPLLWLIMTITAGISSFMNNTTATAMLVPAVTGMVRRLKLSPGKFLMPLAFASMLGGTCTLIGTSTNVAVSGYLARSGHEPVGLFEITPMGLIILTVGILYMMFVGVRLLPDAPGKWEESASLREYFCDVVIQSGSPLVEQRVFESDFSILGFRVVRIRRPGASPFTPTSRDYFREGDIVSVSGRISDLRNIQEIEGLTFSEKASTEEEAMMEGVHLYELLVTPHSGLAGRSLEEIAFRQRYGFNIVAIHREGSSVPTRLKGTRLRVGDVLLVEGREEKAVLLGESRDLTVLQETAPVQHDLRAGKKAAAIFVAAIVLGTGGWMPLPIAFLGAALGMIIFGCLPLERAYQHIDWRLLILIGGMTAFGVAMEKTGAAVFLGNGVAAILEPWGLRGVLAGFFLLTIILTQPMSNAAAALVVLPIAISTANALNADPRTFGIGIMLAASISFITPFEPSCVIVYGAGGYRFRDYVKVGSGLTLVLSVVVLWLLPYFWPLTKG